jgi:hypothetical protein
MPDGRAVCGHCWGLLDEDGYCHCDSFGIPYQHGKLTLTTSCTFDTISDSQTDTNKTQIPREDA